jgi:hypothetical protein
MGKQITLHEMIKECEHEQNCKECSRENTESSTGEGDRD